LRRQKKPWAVCLKRNIKMVSGSVIETLEKMINGILEEMPGYFLVQVRIKPTNNIKVFLDGDSGITIETCIKINRKLYAIVEEQGVFPDGDFSLEVSSPGVGEPLVMLRQYVKNIGRYVRVEGLQDVRLSDQETDAVPFLEGELKAVNQEGIELETSTGKGKKLQLKHHNILFRNIKSTSVQIKF
jgi:ribosome maturation factor RimP